MINLNNNKIVFPEYELYDDIKLSHIKEFKEKNEKYFYELLIEIPCHDSIQSTNTLLDNGYTYFLGYYFHPILNIDNKHKAKLIYKYVVLENMSKNINSFLGKYIFTADKYVLYRKPIKNISDRVDRLDAFIGCIGVGPNSTDIVRFSGTLDGHAAYSQVTGEKTRQINKLFLRVLHTGPNSNKLLDCHYSHEIIEGLSEFSHTHEKIMIFDDYEIHHGLFIENCSYFYDIKICDLTRKLKDPSSYLSDVEYKNFTTKIVSELLGCIVLSVKRHAILHRLEISDGIDRWLHRFHNNICEIPYHWKSEDNYKKTISWISENCKKVDISKLLNYDNFIKLHSIKK